MGEKDEINHPVAYSFTQLSNLFIYLFIYLFIAYTLFTLYLQPH